MKTPRTDRHFWKQKMDNCVGCLIFALATISSCQISSASQFPPEMPFGGAPDFPFGDPMGNITNYCAADAELPSIVGCPSCKSRCGELSSLGIMCSCDPACKVYGDCCADYNESCPAERNDGMAISDSYHNLKTACIGYSGVGNSAAVIAQCADSSPCQTSSYDVNLGIPVTDVTTGYHYLNARCAICNKVRNAKPWNTNASCDLPRGSANLTFNTTNLGEALLSRMCTLKIGEPPLNFAVRTCKSGTLSMCSNPTCQNRELKDLCENSVIQAYTSSIITTYKNYYCAMCSMDAMMGLITKCGLDTSLGEPEITQTHRPDVHSVSVGLIFDFDPRNGLEVGKDKDDIKKCPEGSVWVPDDGICRDLACQPGFIIVENECYPSELNYTIEAMVMFENEKDSRKLAWYLSDTESWSETLDTDIRGYYNHHHPNDGQLSTAFQVTEGEKNTVNVTSYLVMNLSQNTTFNETDFKKFIPIVQENIRVRIFEILQQLGIDTTKAEIVFEDKPVAFPVQRLDCTWVVYNSSEYFINNTILYLPATGASYDHTRYDLQGEIALVCVPSLQGEIKYPSSDAFTIIITICTILSIICLLIRIVLHFFFSYFRSFAGRLQFNLCMALCLAYFFLLVGGLFIESDPKAPCVALGFLTYLFFLAAFGWMTAIALNTWVVFRPSSSFIKADDRSQSITTYVLIGWVLPVVLALLVLGLDYSPIDPRFKPSLGTRLCWINQRYALLVYFGLPVAFCISMNIILFILTVCVLRKTFKAAVNTTSMPSSEVHNIGIYVRLFILMGLSWGIGFIACFTGLLAIWILYAVLNASQGILIFISFVCRRPILKMIFGKLTNRDESSDGRSHGTKSTSASTEGAHIALTKHGRLNS